MPRGRRSPPQVSPPKRATSTGSPSNGSPNPGGFSLGDLVSGIQQVQGTLRDLAEVGRAAKEIGTGLSGVLKPRDPALPPPDPLDFLDTLADGISEGSTAMLPGVTRMIGPLSAIQDRLGGLTEAELFGSEDPNDIDPADPIVGPRR